MIAAARDISSAMLFPAAPVPPACVLVVAVELELADEVEVVVVLFSKLISTLHSILRSYTSNPHNIETKRREKKVNSPARPRPRSRSRWRWTGSGCSSAS
jgi:hypothetical protein